MLRDFSLLEWLGANSFGPSLPYDEAWLGMANRLGVVVIDEVPAVGMNSWNKNEAWFSADKLGSRTLEHHLACIRELDGARLASSLCGDVERRRRGLDLRNP